MESICRRCALRLQRVAQQDSRLILTRAFSSTPTHQKQLPKFEESSNDELNSLLNTLRTQYLIPEYLKKHERRMLFSPKHKQYITENSVATQISGEEIPLEWLGDVERPVFSSIVKRATELIIKGDGADWANIPKLLQGTHEGLQKRPHHSRAEQIVRKAIEAGRMDIVMELLHSSKETGVSLKNAGLRRYVMAGLREQGQRDDWGEEGLKAALSNAQKVATMLESPEHGSGKSLQANDPRTQPEVIGVFLELAAVYAYKYQDGEDASGMVKAYAERLLHSLERNEIKVELRDQGLPQWPMLSAISIWHGLRLALKFPSIGLKNPAFAQKTLADFEPILAAFASELEKNDPLSGSYSRQALTVWQSCIRD